MKMTENDWIQHTKLTEEQGDALCHLACDFPEAFKKLEQADDTLGWELILHGEREARDWLDTHIKPVFEYMDGHWGDDVDLWFGERDTSDHHHLAEEWKKREASGYALIDYQTAMFVQNQLDDPRASIEVTIYTSGGDEEMLAVMKTFEFHEFSIGEATGWGEILVSYEMPIPPIEWELNPEDK